MFIVAACLLALVLLVWFKTEAFVEYVKLIGLKNFFFVKDYEAHKDVMFDISYAEYLKKYKSGFVTRLIGCPICLSVWLAPILAVTISSIALWPLINILGLIIYGFLNRLLGEDFF